MRKKTARVASRSINSFWLLCIILSAIHSSSLCKKFWRDWSRVWFGQHSAVAEVSYTQSCSLRYHIIFSSRQHNNKNPVSGENLEVKDLITLHYSRNASGAIHDPISFKPFSEHSHIVCIATTGNVFLAESIKGGKDILAEVSFRKYV